MTELKRKILDASSRLVAERGVRGVSFREVARRAGVSHQAPYHEFGNYVGIMKAVAREGFSRLGNAMVVAARDAGPDPLDSLTAAGLAYVSFARSHVGHFRVMFERSLVDIHDATDPMPEAEFSYNTLVRLATEAHDAGYGRGLSGEEIAHTCWSTVHGVAILLVEGILVPKAGKATETEQEDAIARRVVESVARLLDPRS